MGTPTYGRQRQNLPPQGTPAGAYGGAGSVPQGDQTADALMRTADEMVVVYRKERDDAKVLRKQLQDAIDEGDRTRGSLSVIADAVGMGGSEYGNHDEIMRRIEQMKGTRSALRAAQSDLAEARQSGVLMAEQLAELVARLNEAEELLRKQCLVNPEDISLPEMMGKAHRAYIVFENRDGSGTKVLLKDNFARGWNGTTTRVIDFQAPEPLPDPPARLQPLKCPCGGTIEFGDLRIGVCQKCGERVGVLEHPKAEPVTMAPPDTCDQITRLAADLHATGAALGEANRNTAKWRNRARQWRMAALNERARLLNLRGELIPKPEPLPEGWEDCE